MSDVDPSQLDPNSAAHTPRSNALPAVVANARRITEQQMRSNPMTNAIVPSGLTRWRGNYGGDFVWIGEFLPGDPNTGTPQRGVSITRDDLKHETAFAVYDFDPEPGVPLRQRIISKDADGRRLFQEGASGGQEFPRFHVPMYTNGPHNNTSSDTSAFGRSHIVGRKLEWMVYVRIYSQWPVQGAPGFANVNVPLPFASADAAMRVALQVQVQAGGYNLLTTTQSIGPTSGFLSGTLDLSGPFDDQLDYMIINVPAVMSGASSARNMYQVFPVYFHNYTLD